MKWEMYSDGLYSQETPVILEANTPLKAVQNRFREHLVKHIGPGEVYEATVGFIKNTVYLRLITATKIIHYK